MWVYFFVNALVTVGSCLSLFTGITDCFGYDCPLSGAGSSAGSIKVHASSLFINLRRRMIYEIVHKQQMRKNKKHIGSGTPFL